MNDPHATFTRSYLPDGRMECVAMAAAPGERAVRARLQIRPGDDLHNVIANMLKREAKLRRRLSLALADAARAAQGGSHDGSR